MFAFFVPSRAHEWGPGGSCSPGVLVAVKQFPEKGDSEEEFISAHSSRV